MKKIILSLFISILGLGCASIPAQQHFTLQGDHGELSAVLQTPKHKTTYPLVLILHGFNANKEMYLLTELAEQLHARGIATLMFDFNGHGQSEGSFLDMTVPNEMEDARKVYAYAAQLPRVSSISMAGHSMGAIIAAMLGGELGADKIKAIVLMSPAPELKKDTAKGDLFGVRYNPKNPPEYITFSNGLKVGRAFLKTTQNLPIYDESSRYTGPVLVIQSQDDELAPYHASEAYSRIFAQGQLKTLHGFDHNFTQDTPAVDKLATDFFVEQLLNN